MKDKRHGGNYNTWIAPKPSKQGPHGHSVEKKKSPFNWLPPLLATMLPDPLLKNAASASIWNSPSPA